MSVKVALRTPVVNGWELIDVITPMPNALPMARFLRDGVRVCSTIQAGEEGPEYSVSISREDDLAPSDRDVAIVRDEFDMDDADEDNRGSKSGGKIRHLWLAVPDDAFERASGAPS